MRWQTLGITFACLSLAACTGELTFDQMDPNGGGGGGGGGGGADVDAGGGGGGSTAREMFEQEIVPLLELDRPLGTCDSCHIDGGGVAAPPFLAEPAYDTLTEGALSIYLGDSADASPFVLIGGPPGHTGDGFCDGPETPEAYCTENERAIVGEWVDLVNQ